MEAGLVDRLAAPSKRADLTQYAGSVHLVLLAIDDEADGDPASDPVARPIDIIGGRNWVVTVHDGPLEALVRLDAEREGETRLGALDAGTFVAAVVDEVLADYFELVEDIEREIDRLDERALRGRPDRGVLSEIVRLRRRIGLIRRILAPHRVAFAALARPDMDVDEEAGRPWPGLTDRLDRLLDAVQNLRELLLGTFDIQMATGRPGCQRRDEGADPGLGRVPARRRPGGRHGHELPAAVLRRAGATSGWSSSRWPRSR